MKKTILYIAASTIGFGLMLTNCSKKADPAPAASTSTTGTTTTSTTGTTTTSTTTSGTTTAGTTTSSTTTSSTTSSTTAGATTTIMTFDGTGSFTIDGKEYKSKVTYIPENDAGFKFTLVMGTSAPFSIQVKIGTNILKDGTYPVEGATTFKSDKAGIAVVNTSPSGSKQYWSDAATGGSVTVSGKTVTFSNVKLTKNDDAKETMTVSGSLMIQ